MIIEDFDPDGCRDHEGRQIVEEGREDTDVIVSIAPNPQDRVKIPPLPPPPIKTTDGKKGVKIILRNPIEAIKVELCVE